MRTFETILSLILVLPLLACNAQTNILGRTVPGEHKETFQHSLDMAQVLYDQGKLTEARIFAKKAFAIDPDSEAASIVLGYVDLSLAGGDPFALAKALIAADRAKKDKAAAGAPSDGSTPGSTPAATPNTSDTLDSVKAAIGIRESELELLGNKDSSDPEFPVLIPKCVEEVRVQVARLEYINEAIRAICPFVDEAIRNESDYRQQCSSTSTTRTFKAKAHFLWSFSHLTEALAFNAVLSFQNQDATDEKSNLERRVQKIQTADASTPEGIASLLDSMKGLEATVSAIFPAGGVCSELAPTSQLRATLNDMLAVDSGFSRILGMPDNIVVSIKKSMARINGDGSSSIGSRLATMKGDFTKKISGGLSSKIDQLASDPDNPIPEDQQDQICSILGSIGGGDSEASSCND